MWKGPSKALFTRREGNPGAKITLHSHISSLFTRRVYKAVLPTRDNFPPSLVTRNLYNLNGIIQFSELNYKHLNNVGYFLYTMIIFSHIFVNLTCFP